MIPAVNFQPSFRPAIRPVIRPAIAPGDQLAIGAAGDYRKRIAFASCLRLRAAVHDAIPDAIRRAGYSGLPSMRQAEDKLQSTLAWRYPALLSRYPGPVCKRNRIAKAKAVRLRDRAGNADGYVKTTKGRAK